MHNCLNANCQHREYADYGCNEEDFRAHLQGSLVCVSSKQLHVFSGAVPTKRWLVAANTAFQVPCAMSGLVGWQTRNASTSTFVTSRAAHLPAEAACPAKWLLVLPCASIMPRWSSQKAAQA